MFVGYNNSNFDNYLILPHLLDQDRLTDSRFQGASLIKMKMDGRHKFFDLCKVTSSSLKAACKGFKVKNSKLKLDHFLI